MAISDLKSALDILRRVHTEMPVKTQEQRRLLCNLWNGLNYLEDGISALRLTAHGIKPEHIADEILSQLPLIEEGEVLNESNK